MPQGGRRRGRLPDDDWRAAALARLAKVELLLDRGASIDLRDRDGDTALMHATRARDPRVISLLHARGAGINIPDKNGYTPLCRAVTYGSVEVTCEGPSCKGLDHPRVINESEKDAHTAEIRTHQAAEEDAQAESKVSRMNVARKLGTPLEPR